MIIPHVFEEDVDDFMFYFIHNSILEKIDDTLFEECVVSSTFSLEQFGKKIFHVKSEYKYEPGLLNLIINAASLGYNLKDPFEVKRCLDAMRKHFSKEDVERVSKEKDLAYEKAKSAHLN